MSTNNSTATQLLRALMMDDTSSSGSLLSSFPSVDSSPNTKTAAPTDSTCTVYDKHLATVHFLWKCGVWTSNKQNVDNIDSNLSIKPNIAVISPNSIENLDKLSKVIIDEQPQMTQPPLFQTNSYGSNSTFSANSSVSSISSISSIDRYFISLSISFHVYLPNPLYIYFCLRFCFELVFGQ